jgi:hypothetical protein
LASVFVKSWQLDHITAVAFRHGVIVDGVHFTVLYDEASPVPDNYPYFIRNPDRSRYPVLASIA